MFYCLDCSLANINLLIINVLQVSPLLKNHYAITKKSLHYYQKITALLPKNHCTVTKKSLHYYQKITALLLKNYTILLKNHLSIIIDFDAFILISGTFYGDLICGFENFRLNVNQPTVLLRYY